MSAARFVEVNARTLVRLDAILYVVGTDYGTKIYTSHTEWLEVPGKAEDVIEAIKWADSGS